MDTIVVPLSKRQIIEKSLTKSKVLIGFAVQTKGVDIPAVFKDEIVLRLNLSYNFGLPIQINDFGVIATLTFTGNNYKCKIPWKAIFSIIPADTEIPFLILEDVPEQFKSEDGNGEELEVLTTPPVEQKVASTTRERPHFTLIQGEKQ